MKRSIWMAPWDLEGREPDAVLDELEEIGLNACSLALAYHGGRMVLPRHPWRVVYEQHPSALYFPSTTSRYERLKPALSPLAEVIPPFLAAAARRNFPVEAWTVFCHNDHLGSEAADCTVENAFGDRYTFALCPSHPGVQAYVRALAADVAALPGIAGIDAEALSFLGYDHGGLHDKRGVRLSPAAIALLSLCFCEHCKREIGPQAESFAAQARREIRNALDGADAAFDRELFQPVLDARRRTLLELLSTVRHAAGSLPINLRLATDPWFSGGKTALPLDSLRGLVDAVTVTYFGLPVTPPPAARPLPMCAGFVFHAPDCASAQDVAGRIATLAGAGLDGLSFYCYSMAGRAELDWLRQALKGVSA